ncbi:flagellar export protein FliJ [Hydrogenovibrio halophilus]|uniref:flagellar export protein FliJ n=1 Tax=Hydrogenovibrio halophilus TaxID=373391 RepID=UPI0003728C62|nr:flagellar export protein FliJ [Hydrogenovibrio halophilus]
MKHNRIQRIRMLVDLADRELETAQNYLAAQEQTWQQHQTQLESLTEYQIGYLHSLRQAADTTTTQIHTNQAFLNKVNEAIVAQKRQVAALEDSLEEARQHWIEKRAHHQALSRLLEKLEKHETQRLDKQEQKMLDELASQAGSRRPL